MERSDAGAGIGAGRQRMTRPPSFYGVWAATLVARARLPWWRRVALDWFGWGRDHYWNLYLEERKGRV